MILTPRLNEIIRERSQSLRFEVADVAPSTIPELFGQARDGLTVWSGGSDHTIYGDPTINWAFRAIHDRTHLQTRLSFSIADEILLGEYHAAEFTGRIADIVYMEVAGQALYFQEHGEFPADQTKFVIESLESLWGEVIRI